jgi:acyl-CoA oxidase
LREVVFGAHWPLHRRVRDIVAGLGDVPPSGLTYSEETQLAPDLLRAVITKLGLPAREIATDPQLRGALCDWAQVAAPRLLLVLTGHFDLAIGAILRLGNGSPYQQNLLAELDSGAALGLLILTELGGTNGADQQTLAEWDASTNGFWLTSPSVTAWKYFPNGADRTVPKIAVVTARLLVDGVDQGVLPFLFKLRTSTGLAKGVQVVALPDKSSAPMDHGLFRFERVWLPREALLGGDWARMTPDGRFECGLPPRQRFHRAIGVLKDGRLDLANAAAASARAALAGLVNYAQQRRPGSGVRMADRDAVQQDLVSGLAAVYATSVLGRRIRDMRVTSTMTDREQTLWPMLAKPLLSYTAHQVLHTCRQRAAAQGALRINHLVDWIGNLEAIITAEGENRILWCTAGKSPDIAALQLPDVPAQLPWYVDMLIERELRIAAGLRSGTYDLASIALGPESAAVEMAAATSERLAVTALLAEALATTDPHARRLAESAAAAYALERIHTQYGSWFTAHPDMPRVAGELRHYRTVLTAQLPTMVAAFDMPQLPGPIFSLDYVQSYQDYASRSDATFAGAGTQ